jgi:hypothetical protein
MSSKKSKSLKKPKITLKTLKPSENIFKMPRVLKKKLQILKKGLRGNCRIVTMASLPVLAKQNL